MSWKAKAQGVGTEDDTCRRLRAQLREPDLSEAQQKPKTRTAKPLLGLGVAVADCALLRSVNIVAAGNCRGDMRSQLASELDDDRKLHDDS